MEYKTTRKLILSLCLSVISFSSISQIPTRIIVNGGFESPVIGCSPPSFNFIPHGSIEGWRTLDSIPAPTRNCGVNGISVPYLIEYWSSGFNGRFSHGGNQLAEINASQATFLYQEICVLANEVVPFSVWHLRRAGSGVGEQMVAELKTTNNVNISTASTHIAGAAWTNYTGNLTNNGATGIRRYGFRAISGGSLGNLIDDVTISLRPLVDIKDFKFPLVYETDTNFLRIYVNGTLNGPATVSIAKSGSATYLADYTIGLSSRGSVAMNANGDITLSLPAGDYDPNISSGTNAGYISIPYYTINDGITELNETVNYTITGSANGGAGNPALNIATGINGQSAACAVTVASAQFVIRDAIALPVKLISFTAEKEVGFNTINWEVAEESNIYKYLLEYSVNGNEFTIVDEILFNPSNNNNYSSSHHSIENKSAYYRLSVKDNEGYLSVLSDVVLLSKTNSNIFSIYPNPNKGSFTANFFSSKEALTEFTIYDIFGKKINSISVNAVKGENSIPIDLDESLSTGMYYITYAYGTFTKTLRIDILR